MEGVRDAVSLSLTAERWRWSSVPSRPRRLTATGQAIAAQLADRRFLARRSQRRDALVLAAELRQGARPQAHPQRTRRARRTRTRCWRSRCRGRRRPFLPAGDTLWAGLTYQLDDQGLDLSRSQFIELWVNDFNDTTTIRRSRGRSCAARTCGCTSTSGRVSEDQMRAPNRPPNGVLDSPRTAATRPPAHGDRAATTRTPATTA